MGTTGDRSRAHRLGRHHPAADSPWHGDRKQGRQRRLFGRREGVPGTKSRDSHESRAFSQLFRTKRGWLDIGQAAAAVGYGNASNFTAAFRKQYGMNPSEYVRRQFS
ncbi:AraC family transcriptional regulator [Mesorhizobium sp. M00.F.Ca.ET.186.01.1.1]|nr:AraC family transcriptional regulator [Mesorhizobium sp. M00.F.Ca.ET.186.01.1.1]